MVAIKSVLTLMAIGTHAALAVSNVICSSELGTKSIQSNKILRATTTVSERITIVKKFIRKALYHNRDYDNPDDRHIYCRSRCQDSH